jgi:cyclophilin family peptidyl-prolyl cis-trans isomerase
MSRTGRARLSPPPWSPMANSTHKSATSVTLAPVAEKSTFAVFVSKYWIHGLILFLAVAGWVVFQFQQSQTQAKGRAESWDKLAAASTLDGMTRRIPKAEPSAFEGLAAELKGTDVGPWTRWLEANSLLNQRKFTEAQAALDKLKAEYPGHPLVADKWTLGGEGASLTDAWLKGLAARSAWEASHSELFANAAPAAGSPRVVIHTSLGDIEITLFSDKAPQHAAAFLDQCVSGYYKDTKFHRIDPEMGVDAGDPNSAGADVAQWGQGGKDKVAGYVDTGLYHFAGVVSAAMGSTRKESLTSQFSVLTKDRHDLDGQRVVFGVVTAGMDIVQQIASAAQATDGSGRPESPISITGVDRL